MDRRPGSQRIFKLLGIAALVGCDSGPGSRPIDESLARAPQGIEGDAMLAVGVVAGDSLQECDRVVTPFVVPDGRLVVPLAGSRDIRVFSPNGGVERFGRRGRGPGEFEFLSGAWPQGDTIEAFDSELRRVTRFLPDGSVEVVPIQSGPYRDLSVVAGPLNGGWTFGGVEGQIDERDRIVFHYLDRGGDHLGALDSLGGMVRHADAGYGGPAPLSPRAVFASDGIHPYLGDTLVPVVRRVRFPGIVAGEIEWEPLESMSARAADNQVIELAASRSSRDRGFATRARLQAAPVPSQLSVFWDFLLDPEGFIWVQPYQPLAHAFALGATALGGVAGDPSRPPAPASA